MCNGIFEISNEMIFLVPILDNLTKNLTHQSVEKGFNFKYIKTPFLQCIWSKAIKSISVFGQT